MRRNVTSRKRTVVATGTLAVTLVFAISFLSGCSGNQSALNPAGDQAGGISRLWWLFCIVMVAIYLVVQIFFLWGIGKRAPEDTEPILIPDPKREQRLAWGLGIFIGFTAVVLLVFMLGDFFTGVHTRKLDDPHPLRILITGHQWWWEVQYEDETPSNIVVTANEIHIPVGK